MTGELRNILDEIERVESENEKLKNLIRKGVEAKDHVELLKWQGAAEFEIKKLSKENES